MRSPSCVSMSPSPPTFNCLNQSLWNLLCAHLNGVLYKSLPPVCVSVCVSLLLLLGKGSVKCIHNFSARQRLGKHVPAATNARDNKRIVGRVIFYVVRVVSKESKRLVLPRTSYSSLNSLTEPLTKARGTLVENHCATECLKLCHLWNAAKCLVGLRIISQ
jgi:hypothetical protein